MNKYVLICMGLFLCSCSAQKVQPTAPVYNITINNTDNSQCVVGNNNETKAKPKTETKTEVEIKPVIDTKTEQTTKNGIWIYLTLLTVAIVAAIAFVWYKYFKI